MKRSGYHSRTWTSIPIAGLLLLAAAVEYGRGEAWRPNESGLFHFSQLHWHDYLSVGWIRMAVPWCILQPDSLIWDWARFDTRYQRVVDAGLKKILEKDNQQS